MRFKKGKLVNTLLVGVATLGIAFGATSCDFGEAQVDWDLPTDDPETPVTVEFWHCLGQEKESTLKELVDGFNETEYGKYYNIVLVDMGGSYDDIHDQIMTNLAVNDVPALAMGYPDSFAEYMTDDIEESYLIRLDNFINDSNYGYSATELADFVPDFLSEGQNYHFDGTWSMPMYKSTEVMYYNKGYFAGNNAQTLALLGSDTEYAALVNTINSQGKAPTDDALEELKTYVDSKGGYTYEVPTTWDEMINTARQMLADRNTESVSGEFVPLGYDSDSNMLITQFAQRDIPYTRLIEDGEDASAHIQFNNDEAKAFVSDIVSLIKEGVLVTKNSLGGDTYTSDYLNAEKMAMSIGSTGGSTYQQSSIFGVGLAPVPHYTDENDEGEPLYIQQGPSICFFNNENEYVHKGAWLFYKYLAEPENNAYLALQNSYDPVRLSSYETEDYETWLSLAGRGELSHDIPAITATLREYYMSSPVFIGSSQARTAIGEIITDVANSNYSIDYAFETAYTYCLRYVK